jgi:uracil-DNA glycosylase family 4
VKKDWESASAILTCEDCPLHLTRIHAVVANAGKRYKPGGLAFMTDGPRWQEDEVGLQLVAKVNRGRKNGGAIFDELLAEVGLERADVLVLSRIRCAPPRGQFNNFPEAFANCERHTVAELTAYDPGVVVLMGARTIPPVYGAKAKITLVRGTRRATGEKFEWGSRVWVPTYHPSAAVQDADLRSLMREDFRLAVAEVVDNPREIAHNSETTEHEEGA